MGVLKKLCIVAVSITATMLIAVVSFGLAVYLADLSILKPHEALVGVSQVQAASVYADCISAVKEDSPVYHDMVSSCRTVSVKLSACHVKVGTDCAVTSVGDK